MVLFALQHSDLDRAATGSLAPDFAPESIEDPTALDEPTLWAAMAVEPIGQEARKARAELWEPARRSLHLGMLVTLLIFLAVPPIYLFDTFVPLLVGAPLIVIVALAGAIRVLMPGGELEQGFDAWPRPCGRWGSR